MPLKWGDSEEQEEEVQKSQKPDGFDKVVDKKKQRRQEHLKKKQDEANRVFYVFSDASTWETLQFEGSVKGQAAVLQLGKSKKWRWWHGFNQETICIVHQRTVCRAGDLQAS